MIEKKIIQLAKDYNNVPLHVVVAESSLKDDLSLDSLDCIELTMAVEDEFDIEIADEEADKLETIQHIVDLVERLR